MVVDLLNGLSSMITPYHVIIISFGVILGLIFGSIPGLTATMAVAIFLPVTFTMEPVSGMALLMGLYIGGMSGGFIPAILLKLPGTPSSIATTFDGYVMAQQGKAGRALGLAIVFSFLSGLLSVIVLTFISPLLADIAIKFGPFEYFAITMLALTLISSLSEGTMVKGMISGVIGLLLAMVGSAPIDSYARFTFGMKSLDAGFNLLPALIGLFAVSEIIMIAENKIKPLKKEDLLTDKIKGFGFTIKDFFQQFWNFLRSAILGIGIGILPGLGGSTANIVAYATSKNRSKTPENFGKGHDEGVVAPESANNAATGGALVPLMALGIPGDTVTAMILGGLIIHGIEPGPLFFTEHADVAYGIFAALFIANIFMVVFLFFGIRVFIKILSVPRHILMPIIIVLCVVGAFAENNRVFDMGALLFFGVIGYVLLKLKFPITPIILGFILGPIAELNLRRGLMSTQGDFLPFLTEPIALAFWIVTILSVILSARKKYKSKGETTNV